jgi:hypothetical protein
MGADLRRLPAAAADAETLDDVLGDPAIGDFTVDVTHSIKSSSLASRILPPSPEGRSSATIVRLRRKEI